jgi:acyl-coenzyme A thioesterase PaaI-like protein
VSTTCFACGIDNTLGLRARLTIDHERVGGVWAPSAAFRAGDALATVAVTTLLDEAAFWLGAAASGEAGMTTELRIRLHAPAAFGRVVVAGSRASVRARADDPRYWDTEIAAWDDRGTLVATAAITFVAVRGVARKLVAGLLAVNPPDVLRRVFPTYVR